MKNINLFGNIIKLDKDTMFKAIKRGLKTEQKSIIDLKITMIGTQVEKDC